MVAWEHGGMAAWQPGGMVAWEHGGITAGIPGSVTAIGALCPPWSGHPHLEHLGPSRMVSGPSGTESLQVIAQRHKRAL